MQLNIDNLTGAGPLDYSSAVCLAGSGIPELTVQRKLNAPSTLRATLALTGSGLPLPARQARVRALSAAGRVLFTGYVVTEPQPLYAGADSTGAVYRLQLSAISDEWLLDKQSAGLRPGSALSGFSGSFVQSLVNRTDAGRLVAVGVTHSRTVGVVALEDGAAWSKHVASVGNAAHATYRVLDGSVSFANNGNTTHTFAEGDGSLVVSHLRTGAARELANDVSLAGAEGSSTYWTELFAGDGTTSTFYLTGEPTSVNAGHKRVVAEDFLSGFLDLNRWSVADPGSHLSAGAAGLTFSGGNGSDGQTTLTANDALELGGSLVFELKGVSLAANSVGVLAGLYAGATLQSNCLAGFSIKQSSGNTVVTPLVNGVETGSTFTVVSGHVYTLRMRLMSRETVRVKQIYYAMVDGQVQAFGGGLAASPLSLVFEIRDEGASSNTPVTVLYDSVLPASPAVVSIVAVNSIQLFGSLGAINVVHTGTGWIRSTPPATGITVTRAIGIAGQGTDCLPFASVTGKVTFFVGRQPAAGESVSISYRGRRRAVARVADPASIAHEATGGGVGTARWVGHVVSPVARSAEDCEAAAMAVLVFATNRNAATRPLCRDQSGRSGPVARRCAFAHNERIDRQLGHSPGDDRKPRNRQYPGGGSAGLHGRVCQRMGGRNRPEVVRNARFGRADSAGRLKPAAGFAHFPRSAHAWQSPEPCGHRNHRFGQHGSTQRRRGNRPPNGRRIRSATQRCRLWERSGGPGAAYSSTRIFDPARRTGGDIFHSHV